MLFAELAELAVQAFRDIAERAWWWPQFVCPACGAAVVWATRRWFRGAEGSGIPQAIAEIHVDRHPPSGWRPLLWPRIVIGKLVLGAVACGLAGGSFARLMLLVTARDGPSFSAFRNAHPVTYAAVCGLLIAVIDLIADFSSFGTGYVEARNLFENDAQLPWHFGIDKFFATLLSYASGVPGGIFAPTLAIGAGIGNNIAALLANQIATGTVLVLCTAGFLAAITQAPITAFVIVMEMVSGYGVIIDLMIVALLASVVSRSFCPPLYRTLAQRMIGPPGR